MYDLSMNFPRVEAMMRGRVNTIRIEFCRFHSYALYILEIIIEEQSAIIFNKREENARLPLKSIAPSN